MLIHGKSLFIENKHSYHCEIIESIIVNIMKILNIEKCSINIFLLLNNRSDSDFKKYIRNKYLAYNLGPLIYFI